MVKSMFSLCASFSSNKLAKPGGGVWEGGELKCCPKDEEVSSVGLVPTNCVCLSWTAEVRTGFSPTRLVSRIGQTQDVSRGKWVGGEMNQGW